MICAQLCILKAIKLMIKHANATNKSYEMGLSAETLFMEVGRKLGWKVIPSPPKCDYLEHWDFMISNYTGSFKVEVKSRKRINRSDVEPNDVWTWIELHGVLEKHKGWLYGSKADLIAFETATGFVLIERVRLIQLVEKLVKNIHVKRASEAKYCLYSRNREYDLVTLIETKHIIANQWAVWVKQGDKND